MAETPKTTVPFNPTPKQRFQALGNKAMGDHRQMVDSSAFNIAVDMALLQYQRESTATIVDGNGAGSVGLRLQGAQEFINVLRNLSETYTLPINRPQDNLKH